MSEDVTTGEREPHPDLWKTNSIYYEETGRSYVSVVPGSREKLGWNIWATDPRDEDGGHVYYLSLRHFEKLESGGAQAEHGNRGDLKEPLKPGDRAEVALLALYQSKADVPHSLQVITNAVDDYCKKRGWQTVGSRDTVHHAAERLGYRAPRKARPPRGRK
jgi:hypothetical protein